MTSSLRPCERLRALSAANIVIAVVTSNDRCAEQRQAAVLPAAPGDSRARPAQKATLMPGSAARREAGAIQERSLFVGERPRGHLSALRHPSDTDLR
jgi:hypothetical protein